MNEMFLFLFLFFSREHRTNFGLSRSHGLGESDSYGAIGREKVSHHLAVATAVLLHPIIEF